MSEHIFLHQDVRHVFRDKTVVVLGDSIQRSVYKDLVCLWHDPSSRYLTESELRAKGELSFLGDKLLLGGQLGERVNGVQYKEVREFRDVNTVFRFYFITRCFNDYVQSVLNEFKTLKPDIVIMNSCYWDVHHYGEEGRKKYQQNLDQLFSSVSALPSHPVLLWVSALPLAEQCKGGFLRQGFKTLPRGHVLWANDVARDLTRFYLFIYIDLFFALDGNQFFTQAEDGIHWGKRAHRKISNSILAAVCTRLAIRLPLGRQLNSAPNLAFPERFIENSWPRNRFLELDYYDRVERNLNLRHDRYGLPPAPLAKPLLGGLENFLPLNVSPFLTPPPQPIARYLDQWPVDFSPLLSRVNNQLPRYFSEPLPSRKRKLPMVDDYRKRFDKIKQINNPNTNQTQTNAPETPQGTQSSTTTAASENVVNGTDSVSNTSTPSTSASNISEVNSVSKENKDSVENIDETNNRDNEPEKAIPCADVAASSDDNNNSQETVGAKKRKREEDQEEDSESSPPAKQGKQLDDTPVRCQLRFESFL